MTPDASLDAAELALGLLEGDERAAAIARAVDNPAFAQEVATWRVRFSALLGSYSPETPDHVLEQRIVDGGAPAALALAIGAGRRWAWLAGGAAGGALAAGLAALLLFAPAAPVAPPVSTVIDRPLLVAAVAPADDRTGAPLPVVVEPAAHAIRVAAAPAVPARRVAQLWRIGGDGVPHSLGLLRATGTTELRVTVALTPGDVLAISIEPEGGAPGARPTGPVIATGPLLRT